MDFGLQKTFRLFYRDQLVKNVKEIIRYNSVRFWRRHITLEAIYFMKFFHCLELKKNQNSTFRRQVLCLPPIRHVENGFPSRGQLNMNYPYFLAEDETDPVPVTQWFKRKVFPIHAMKTYRGNRGTTPLILNSGTRKRQVVDFMPRPLYPREWQVRNDYKTWMGPTANLEVLETITISVPYHYATGALLVFIFLFFNTRRWTHQVLRLERAPPLHFKIHCLKAQWS
jgi:hypothetical protein